MAKTALIKVIVKNGDIAKALKVFKKKVNDSGHLLELRDRKEYTKPKTVRRTIKLKAIRENQRKVMLERMASGEYNNGKKNKK
jgi:ribosomal protein S21